MAAPVLDQAFDRDTLSALRTAVRAQTIRSGLPGPRADEVTIVVRELAANAVQHGAGRGRLRVWDSAGELSFHLSPGRPTGDPPGRMTRVISQPFLGPRSGTLGI
jgi:anti-sigma regulatory factor (Ser/Thr protein kinase)